MQRAVGSVFALAVLLASPSEAQTLVLEAEAGIESLFYCQWLHVPATCEYRHISQSVPPAVGEILQLDGKSYYIVEWMGPGYHLESGVILQPTGAVKRGLEGQNWLEIYPDEGKIRTSNAWNDVDGNLALSTSDMLTLDSAPAAMVKDVRFQLRLRPAPPQP